MGRGATRALTLATLALAANFWAWNLLGPLAPRYRDDLGLSPLQVSIMVAIPTLVGSLGRIPVGALTDRYGGRMMFTALTAAVIVPVLALSVTDSYPGLLLGGFVLGIAGASFAIGVPYVSQWVPPERRGLALGIYGAGNGGTALSGFVSPPLAENVGQAAPYVAVAVALALAATAFAVLGRDVPGRTPSPEPALVRFRAAARLPVTLDLSLVYAVTFGGFVAFGVYLPTYLADAYDLTTSDAAIRAAVFVVIATASRPVGGALADRRNGATVLLYALVVIGGCAIIAAFEPALGLATVAFLTMAVALGIGNGAIFALLGQRTPTSQVGSVTGIVGAAGGLGGFLPPIVMGIVVDLTGSYAIGLMLLSDVAFAAAVYTAWRLRDRPGRTRSGDRPGVVAGTAT